jgi:hypothetical protein
LNKNFGTHFSNFVCLEYELRNVFSKIFAEFEPGKFRKESRGAEEKNPQGSSKQEYLYGTKFGVNHI